MSKEIILTLKKQYAEASEKLSIVRTRKSELDKAQQDILHYIEGINFNASEGYQYAKALKEIRLERRQAKHNEDILAEICRSLQPALAKLSSYEKKFEESGIDTYKSRILSRKENILESIKKLKRSV